MTLKTTLTVSAAALALGITAGAQAGTLEDVKARGTLNCVVSTGVAGFAYADDKGTWRGFDVDFCRATAAAVLADLAKREINDVLIEAGPAVTGNLLSRRLVDELVIYQAPHIMGSETMTMFRTPGWQALSDRQTVEVADLRRVGRDIRITVRVVL